MSDTDPGGGGGGGGNEVTTTTSSDLSELKENFNQQQAKISALKELVRQSEATQGKNHANAQEKVKSMFQKLNHMKSKASRSKMDKSFSEIKEDIVLTTDDELNESNRSEPNVSSRARSETPGSEKIQLLRQQMAQNRQKMAERENNQRGIEELVTQLKAKFDSNQLSMEKSSQLGRSVGDLSALPATAGKEKYKSAHNLSTGSFSTTVDKERIKFLEKRLSEMENAIKEKESAFLNRDPNSEHLKTITNLENKILDFEENLKEKECIIEARTQAVSLLSENMSMKGKNTIDLLEETKQEMFKMQTKFIETENEYKSKIDQLTEEIEMKNGKIANMEEINDILETARFDLTVKNSELESKISEVQDYSTTISELKKINQSLQSRISDLENPDKSDEDNSVTIESLQMENDNLKKLLHKDDHPATDQDLQDKVHSLEAALQLQKDEIEKQALTLSTVEENLQEKTIEYNVLNANFSVLQEKLKSSAPKSLFSMSTDEEAEAEITKLKSQLDEANKSAIKTKLKTKQLQKQIDSLKKSSDSNKEVIRLTEENAALQQKIGELKESRKDLSLRTEDGAALPDSDLEKRIKVLETTCQNQISAIQLLEEQKIDMSEDLNTTKSELTSLKVHIKGADDAEETARVSSHMDTIELEEQIEANAKQIGDLNDVIERLTEEKIELNTKLNNYISENIELLDKLDKLSKGSSAESIEMVENLTTQEKLEMEEFQKSLIERSTDEQSVDGGDNNVMSQDLSESLVKLREESSELMHKIEMFTNERREVLDKMEGLTLENSKLLKEIESLQEDKVRLEQSFAELTTEKANAATQLTSIDAERRELLDNIKELSENRHKLQDEINVLIKSKNSIEQSQADAPATKVATQSANSEPCTKALKALELELENWKKTKDKNVKSKKLAKEARNVHELTSKLLSEFEQIGQELQRVQSELDQQKTESFVEIKSTDETDQLMQKITELETLAETRRSDAERLTAELEELQKATIKSDSVKEESAQTTTEENPSIDDRLRSLETENDRLNDEIRDLTRTLKMDHQTIEQKTQEIIQIRLELEGRVETANREIDILKTLVAEQKAQLIATFTEHEAEIGEKVEVIEKYEQQIAKMTQELIETKTEISSNRDKYIEDLLGKIEVLKSIFDENNDLLESQAIEVKQKQETIDQLNDQIMKLYASMEENANKIIEKEDEVSYLQEIADNQIKGMQSLGDKLSENNLTIVKLNAELNEKNKEIELLQRRLDGGNENAGKIAELTENVKDLETKNKEQLEKLKKFAANLKKKNAQCLELEEKLSVQQSSSDVNVKNEEIKKLQQIVNEREQELAVLQHENSKIAVSLQQSSSQKSGIQVLLNEKQELKSSLEHLKEQLNGAQEQLQRQEEDHEILQQNLQQQIAHLAQQLSHSQVTLKDQLAQLQLLQSEINEKSTQILSKDSEIDGLSQIRQDLSTTTEDLNSKNIKIEKCKAVIKEKNREIKRLQTLSNELLEKLKSLEESSQAQTAVDNFNAQYQDLTEEYRQFKQNSESEIAKIQTEFAHKDEQYQHNQTALQLKVQENQHFIETIQGENDQLKEKIAKLEEGIGFIEERRASLERQTNVLGVTLQEKTSEFEQNEDELLRRLNALSGHDELVEQKLREADLRRQELVDSLADANAENVRLGKQIAHLESQIQELENTKLIDLENDNIALLEQNNALQVELKRQTSEFDKKLADRRQEVDDLENDLTTQLERIENERRQLQESLEKSKDANAELQFDVVRFKEIITSLEQSNSELENEITWIKMQNENLTQDQLEVQELRMQVLHDQNEIENLKSQCQSVQQNHESELNALRQQLTELDSLRTQIGQNQTDDQVFIQNENERLQTLLASKEIEIQNYQRQNLQLQLTAQSNVAAAATQNPFDLFTQPPQQQQPEIVNPTDIFLLREQMDELKTTLQRTLDELNQVQKENFDLSQECRAKETTILELEKTQEQLRLTEDVKCNLNQLQSRAEDLQKLCLEKESEIQSLKAQLLASQSKPNVSVAEAKTIKTFNFNEFVSADEVASETPFDEIVAPQIVEVAVPPNNDHELHNLRQNITNLEQYISDLQIQLRMSANDCEQSAQTIEALEREIQLQQSQLKSLQADGEKQKAEFDEKTQLITGQLSQATLAIQTELQNQQIFYTQQLAALQAEYDAYKANSPDSDSHQQQIEQITNHLNQTIAALEEEIENREAFYTQRLTTLRAEYESVKVAEKVAEEKAVAKSHVNVAAEQPKPVEPPSVTSFISSIFFPDDTTSNVSQIPVAPTEPANFFDNFAVAKNQDDDEEDYSNRQPIVEEVCVAKKAYVCHPEDVPLKLDDDIDDGWGFGSDDAALEEQHQQQSAPAQMSASLISPNRELEIKLQECEDKIQELQLERNRLSEEKSALQMQSAKMLKKLKEYKSLNTELTAAQAKFRKSASVESNELDLAIQEELNNQIKTLETRLKEIKAEHDKDASEKGALQKRIDVLSSANDRMVEMKERQDNEMEACKNKVRQLTQKLEQLEEWGDDNYPTASTVPKPTTDDPQAELLNKQIVDLRLDNEEIQALLDEEKSHTIILEDRIKKLQESLLIKDQLEQEHQQNQAKLEILVTENEQLKNDISNKQQMIEKLEGKINQLKSQMEDSVATIDLLTQESNNIKSYLDQLKTEHEHKIDENNNLSRELSELSRKNTELSAEVDRMKGTELYKNQDSSPNNQAIVEELEEKVQELYATLQHKDAAITNLNERIERAVREDQTQSLVQEILLKNTELQSLKAHVQQIENDKTELENNLSLQLTQQMKSTDVNYEQIIADLKAENQSMEQELQVLNDQVLSNLSLEDQSKGTALELDMKNIEITELKNSLQQLKQQVQSSTAEIPVDSSEEVTKLKETLQKITAQWELALEQRCSELAESWRQHLQQRELEFTQLETVLRQQIDHLQLEQQRKVNPTLSSSQSEGTILDPTAVAEQHHDADSALIIKMQEALENQEVEIVTLKEQLAIRSAEYAAIAAKIDPYGQLSTSSNNVQKKKSTESLETGPNKKSELDLALYMLHQRDMRCEELTEELIHLLGERDTLQLKLSNSIRQIEDIRQKTGLIDVPSDVESTTGQISPNKGHSLSRERLSISDADPNDPNLYSKISQVVDNSRSKTLRQEREERQLQMALLQRDVATLPPEAVAELIGADYTLSRSSGKSSSSVLLNWLWGNNTPRQSDN